MATNGCVIAGTPIAVDIWQSSLTRKCSLFFLTHAHGDHIKGLNSKWSTKFYTSAITARIVQHKLKIRQDLINVLAVGESHIVPLGEMSNETVTVTVFDANHCPGSVMFLFQGSFGSILYTGDFRYDEGIPDSVSQLCCDVDQLYLDNTFCSRNFQFLPRSQERELIIKVIRANSNCKVMIGVRSLGKENLLAYIANCLQTCIVVSEAQLQTLHLLGIRDENIFRNRSTTAGINTVPLSQITPQQVDKWNESRPTIAILPSGWPSSFRHPRIFSVPYSDHCSFVELCSFVQHIRPKKLFAIVKNALPGTSDLSVFNVFLNTQPVVCTDAPRLSFTTNNTIKPKMSEMNSASIAKKRPCRYKKGSRWHFFNKKVQTKGVHYSDAVAKGVELPGTIPKPLSESNCKTAGILQASSVDQINVFGVQRKSNFTTSLDGTRNKGSIVRKLRTVTNIFGGKKIIFVSTRNHSKQVII